MKKIVFVTATNTDIGKTYACEIFLKKFAKNGERVGYFKPIETGVKSKPEDGTKLLSITKELNKDFNFTINDIVPYQFSLPASPFVAKQDINIDIRFILNKIKKLLKFCDILVIEGAGGLMVPIEKDYFMIDLISDISKNFNTQTILISPSNLGNINDTLLSQKALNSYNIKYKWYINLYKNKNSFNTTTLPFYKEYFDKLFFLQEEI